MRIYSVRKIDIFFNFAMRKFILRTTSNTKKQGNYVKDSRTANRKEPQSC